MGKATRKRKAKALRKRYILDGWLRRLSLLYGIMIPYRLISRGP